MAWSLRGMAYPENRREKARTGEKPLYESDKKDTVERDPCNDVWHLWNSAMASPGRSLRAHNSGGGLYADLPPEATPSFASVTGCAYRRVDLEYAQSGTKGL